MWVLFDKGELVWKVGCWVLVYFDLLCVDKCVFDFVGGLLLFELCMFDVIYLVMVQWFGVDLGWLCIYDDWMCDVVKMFGMVVIVLL